MSYINEEILSLLFHHRLFLFTYKHSDSGTVADHVAAAADDDDDNICSFKLAKHND
jgi:hypothetical protein